MPRTRLTHKFLPAVLLLTAALPSYARLRKHQAEDLRQKIRAALFIPNPLPAVDAKSYGSFSPTPEVTIERVTYATGYGLRVSANIYRPTHEPAHLPALIVINGHGADKSSWYSYYTGIEYARAGAVVLTYDPIGEGERNDDHKDATSEHDKLITDPPSMPARMGGLMVTDAMQALSYLASRPDVDPHRIAVLGFSMGSFIASLDSAADPRIHALYLTGGGDLDGPNGYWDASHAVMCQSGPYHALSFLGDRGATIFALRSLAGPTLIVNGTADSVVDIPHHGPDFFADLRNRSIAIAGSDRNAFETTFLPNIGHRSNWVSKDAALWLDRQLHFANWHGKSLASAPTILIADWGTRAGYSFGKSSGRPDRDAGILALDAQVPVLTPDQLNDLPLEDWQKNRPSFVYSAWVAAAEAAARSDTRHNPTTQQSGG